MGQIQRREIYQLMVDAPGAALPRGIPHLLLAGRFSQGNTHFSNILYLFLILLVADTGC